MISSAVSRLHQPISHMPMRSIVPENRGQKRRPQHQRSSGRSMSSRSCRSRTAATAAQGRALLLLVVRGLCHHCGVEEDHQGPARGCQVLPHLLTARDTTTCSRKRSRAIFPSTRRDGLCLLRLLVPSTDPLLPAHGRRNARPAPGAGEAKVCLLWPMLFGRQGSARHDQRRITVRLQYAEISGIASLSPGLVEAIELVYGEGCGPGAARGKERDRRTLLVTRR